MSFDVATGTNEVKKLHPSLLRSRVEIVRPKADVYLSGLDNAALQLPHLQNAVFREFQKHEKKWKRDTRHISSPSEKYLHASYARIIGLGWPVVSLILQTLRRQPDDWFYALRAITGENPVTAQMAGDVKRMTNAWISWGIKRGLL
jgi:hypothetical protein